MVRYAAESGSAHSIGAAVAAFTLTLQSEYPTATQQENTMAETVAINRPSVAKPVSRPRSRKPVAVSASAMAAHLDCTRAYIRKLEGEGVLHRAPGGSGFDVDASRVAYLRYLRRERQQSPRTETDAEHAKARPRCCNCG